MVCLKSVNHQATVQLFLFIENDYRGHFRRSNGTKLHGCAILGIDGITGTTKKLICTYNNSLLTIKINYQIRYLKWLVLQHHLLAWRIDILYHSY